MTPSSFRDTTGNKSSELDIANGSGSTAIAQEVLERHWATFITQDDFNYLASNGINTVRLPVGYWSLGSSFCQGTPYERVASVYQNSWMAVMRAIYMANQAGIGVIVDLHGAVGSQIGHPHSGISDGQTGLFANQDAQDKTIQVLNCLMQQMGEINNVVGIELLNEPQPNPRLNAFYNSALESMRLSSPRTANFPLYLHDGFRGSTDIEQARETFCGTQMETYSNTSAGWSFCICYGGLQQSSRLVLQGSCQEFITFDLLNGTSSFTKFSEGACNITAPNSPNLVPRHLEGGYSHRDKEKEMRSESDLMARCWATGYQAAKTFQWSPYNSKIGFLNQLIDDRFASGLRDNPPKSGCGDRFRDGIRAVEGCIEQLNKGST